MERRPVLSYVSRERLRLKGPLFGRNRWTLNPNGLDHLVAIGLIPMDDEILDDLLADELQAALDDNEDNYVPFLKLVSNDPAQSTD